jgi:alanine dehydrogenase
MLNEAGDYLFAHKEGALGPDHILGELGEVLLGRVAGRGAPEEITLFKSLGLAIEDVASASHIYHRARANGGGTAIELGGSHFGSA